ARRHQISPGLALALDAAARRHADDAAPDPAHHCRDRRQAASRSQGACRMSTLSLSLISIFGILLLIGLRAPIGVAMGTVAFFGFWYLRNFKVALSALSDAPFVFAANWELSAIPMFLLMGAIAGNSGIGTGLYRAAYAWFGGWPGGLAVATNWA